MASSRRLTDQERRQIVRERAKGVSVSAISAALKVSPKTVYNVLGRGHSAVSAIDSRTCVLTTRVTDRDLRGFDAALARCGIAHRSDAMRCLMLAADDLLRPDEGMTDELRGLSAALHRVGYNSNQVARRLNEAKLKGEWLSYTPASHAETGDLAALILDMVDQIQKMFRARRRELDIEVTKALAGLARQGAEHSAEWACPLRSRLELGPRQLAGVGEEGADGPDGGTFLCCRSSDSFNLVATFKRVWKYSPDT